MALGARVIEKHITTDKILRGNDHKISLISMEFKTMVTNIRQFEESIGGGSERVVGMGEKINR